MANEIKILNGSLVDHEDGVVLVGVVAPESLSDLLVDDYQREVLSSASRGKKSLLERAVSNNETVPPIELGMRGQKVNSRGNTYLLGSDVYIVDGLQRVSAVKRFNEANPDSPTKTPIWATVHFGTNKEWEMDKFKVLNQGRVRVAPSVLLRNDRHKHNSILTLYGLSCSDKTFILYGRVCWNQRMSRGQLMTALVFSRVARVLHRNSFLATTSGEGAASNIASVLDNVTERVGLGVFRQNIKTFFDALEECWGLRSIQYPDMAVHVKGNFMSALALLMANHTEFWEEDGHLVVRPATKAKFRQFGIHDPSVERLASAGGSAIPLLYNLLRDHLNKGRKIHKLKERETEPKQTKKPRRDAA